ncbi:MAG: uncharacterized protein JWP64_2621 [Pseudonocardia sp.]|jgi:uncharacterized protein (DUF2267 family)|uniref:DUF2267 domain-containing protein n=1 Tax=Pseudonocardia sp. TaxID=60912 RepID=UPI00260D4927|nr:DUF2267 domain-containing protein [Pseudonocardia sp.]MCU1627672.1 uncharacterized protein [Pseudonocardia sp.]MDT7704234.1 hypothetical protein [Pseudonocardiales bacterium]HEV7468742.1 DUF2267 domain-containing protein [Pseudonocardia sp.]
MKYDEFIDAVSERAGLPRDEAESLTHAVLRTLSERLSGGEAEDLRAQLPKGLQEDLIPPQEEAQGFDVSEFTRRVVQRSGIDPADAAAATAAVLSVIPDAVSAGEFDDVLSQLGLEYAALIDAQT